MIALDSLLFGGIAVLFLIKVAVLVTAAVLLLRALAKPVRRTGLAWLPAWARRRPAASA